MIAAAAGAAGLLAHTIYLMTHSANFAAPGASFVAVAWVLAVFTFYGSLHQASRPWGIYGWPVVLLLVVFAAVASNRQSPPLWQPPGWLTLERFWGGLHGLFVLGAAVGVSVGALASLMYLVQADRLRRKVVPLSGWGGGWGGGGNSGRGSPGHFSLERLETMNRRAVNFAFPLLSVGLLIGLILVGQGFRQIDSWIHAKVLGTFGLWWSFVLLFYLRYGVQISGRRLAGLTLAAFGLMLITLAAAHPFATELPAPAATPDLASPRPHPEGPR